MKVDPAKRIVALIVDVLLAALIFFPINLFSTMLAALAAGTFLLVRDALNIRGWQGASPGKKLLGIAAYQRNGQRCDPKASLKRNLPIALGYLVYAILELLNALLGFVPFMSFLVGFGLLISFVIWFICAGMELYKVMTDSQGLRLGDLLADTQVLDLKTVAPSN